MDKKMIAMVAVLAATAVFAGLASAHTYRSPGSGLEFGDRHSEMMDLHEAYFSGEITLEEFQEMHIEETGHGCHGNGLLGFAGMM